MFNIYPITVTWEAENLYFAKCLEVEGAWAEGETAEDAVENCKDAIRGVLRYHREHGGDIKVRSVEEKSFTLEYPMSYA
ncbi:MAG: type II toxin-antitoxin system HicB family antitoxin [Nitrospinae bacterium]|nr:type II toxin-antitoxin system HicB family antitoxin [Nitrospinota bacterium]